MSACPSPLESENHPLMWHAAPLGPHHAHWQSLPLPSAMVPCGTKNSKNSSKFKNSKFQFSCCTSPLIHHLHFLQHPCGKPHQCTCALPNPRPCRSCPTHPHTCLRAPPALLPLGNTALLHLEVGVACSLYHCLNTPGSL